MTVQTILQTKGGEIITLPDTATLKDAVAVLNARNIGVVVILGPAGAIAGILSERDIVRQLGQHGADLLNRPLASAMTRDVVTCSPSTPIAEVMEGMTRRRIRHMPVVDGGRLVGLISIGDVVKAKIEEVEHEAEALRDYIAS